MFRTPAQKVDLAACWLRSDQEFFSSGACHILAGAFLEAHPRSVFQAYLLQPAGGFRGAHVLVAGDDVTFDWKGYQPRSDYLRSFEQERQMTMPGWYCSMIPVSDPLGWRFCRRFHHRHPSQFPDDVLARARRFCLKLLTHGPGRG